jgi:hypothetical protein
MARQPKPQRLKALATYRVLATRARAVLGTTKLTTANVNALARIAAMSAIGKADMLSAAAKASFLVTGAKTGKFFILRELEDILTPSEIRNFDMSKLLQTETQAVDRALAHLTKLLTSAAQVSDVAHVTAGKGVDDPVGTSEALTRAAGKALADTARATDYLTRGLTTNRYDAFTAADVTHVTAGKGLSDTFSTSDTLRRTVSFARFFSDIVITSEDVQVVRIAAGGVPAQVEAKLAVDFAALGVQKNFADAIGVTDDFLGVANTDDDQITFMGKNLVENLPISELRTVALQRTLQESAQVGSSGLVAMTDYCDSAYFSQAYVGTERIFS